jgi:hypothetical protein
LTAKGEGPGMPITASNSAMAEARFASRAAGVVVGSSKKLLPR